MPVPAGAFAFAVLGDAPYNPWEDLQFRLVLRELDAHDLRSVVHVGDIFWRPCTAANYRRSLDWFNGLRHPVIYTPGDNEWFDCWEPGSGRFAPQDRLDRIRKIFFANPSRSLGGRQLTLVSQGGREGSFPEFVENVRWLEGGFLFATVHLIGSWNGLRPFPDRPATEDAAVKRRTEAAARWMRETFAEATSSKARGVVLAFHASPDFERSPASRNRAAYEPFLEALEDEVARFQQPVLAMHGDDHIYTVDRPLTMRGTGRPLENLVRLQVPGSPEVGWVRVTVQPDAKDPFTFERHVVPRWKCW